MSNCRQASCCHEDGFNLLRCDSSCLPTASLEVSNSTPRCHEEVTLSWSTKNVGTDGSVSLDPPSFLVVKDTDDEGTWVVDGTKTFVLTAENACGEVSASVTITPLQPTIDLTAADDKICSTATTFLSLVITNLGVGQSVLLWDESGEPFVIAEYTEDGTYQIEVGSGTYTAQLKDPQGFYGYGYGEYGGYGWEEAYGDYCSGLQVIDSVTVEELTCNILATVNCCADPEGTLYPDNQCTIAIEWSGGICGEGLNPDEYLLVDGPGFADGGELIAATGVRYLRLDDPDVFYPCNYGDDGMIWNFAIWTNEALVCQTSCIIYPGTILLKMNDGEHPFMDINPSTSCQDPSAIVSFHARYAERFVLYDQNCNLLATEYLDGPDSEVTQPIKIFQASTVNLFLSSANMTTACNNTESAWIDFIDNCNTCVPAYTIPTALKVVALEGWGDLLIATPTLQDCNVYESSGWWDQVLYQGSVGLGNPLGIYTPSIGQINKPILVLGGSGSNAVSAGIVSLVYDRTDPENCRWKLKIECTSAGDGCIVEFWAVKADGSTPRYGPNPVGKYHWFPTYSNIGQTCVGDDGIGGAADQYQIITIIPYVALPTLPNTIPGCNTD